LHVGLVSLLERYSGATRPKCEIAAAWWRALYSRC